MKKSKPKPARKKRAAPRTKHVTVAPGQDLHIHVLGARNKEVGCQIAQADVAGNVVVRSPAVSPELEPPPAVENSAGTLSPA